MPLGLNSIIANFQPIQITISGSYALLYNDIKTEIGNLHYTV